MLSALFYDIFHNLFGVDASAGAVIASFIKYFLGVAILMALEATARNKASDRTPTAWSWSFFVKDNIWRVLIGIVVVMGGSTLLTVIGVVFPENVGIWMPLIAGLSCDGIALIIKKFTGLQAKQP